MPVEVLPVASIKAVPSPGGRQQSPCWQSGRPKRCPLCEGPTDGVLRLFPTDADQYPICAKHSTSCSSPCGELKV